MKESETNILGLYFNNGDVRHKHEGLISDKDKIAGLATSLT